MAQIRRQTSLVLEKAPAFNEILSAAYMSDQKMECMSDISPMRLLKFGAVHSDGEKDLGPIIASLSLGLPATMRFRPVPSRWYSDEEVVEGVIRKSPPIVLTLTLRHGDVLIMEGAKIQEYYQVGNMAAVVTHTQWLTGDHSTLYIHGAFALLRLHGISKVRKRGWMSE